MFGRRATIGLALLSALLFSAIAVQSAAAAAATNTTLFTCVKVKPETGTFNDEHCDSDNAGKKGNFEHEAFPVKPPETTEVEINNETTGGTKSLQTLKGNPFSVKTLIECEELKGTGTLGNTEPKVKEHKISGKATLEYSKCKVTEPIGCKVVEPIVATVASVEGVEGITGPKGEAGAMGIEFKGGKPFATITFNPPCMGIKEFPVEGSVIGTSGPGTSETQTNKWAGATSIFYMSSLTAGGKAAEYIGNKTIRMKGGGNPITATTVT